MGLFNFTTGFTGGPRSSESSSLDREYLDYLRQRDQQWTAQYAADRERERADNALLSENAITRSVAESDRDFQMRLDNLELQRQQLIRIGVPEAKANIAYKRAATQLAQDQLVEDRRQFDARLAEDSRQFNVGTGLDVLKTAATLTGPENVFAAADYARGIQQRGAIPEFLRQLRDTGDVTLAGGAQSQAPTPTTIGSLMNRLGAGAVADGGAAAAGGPDEAQRALAAITPIAMAPGKQAPGSVERLMPSERKILGAGISKTGVDAEDWTHRYRQNSGLGFSWAA